MDIASLSMAMSQQNVMSNVGVALLNQSLDLVEAQFSSMSKMIESTPSALETQIGIGTQLDVSV